MKKVIMLFVLMFLLTGCNIMGRSVVRIKTDNIDNILNVVLSKDNDLYNKTGKGYKYYKPMGVLSIDTNEFNEKLYSNGNYYYLYVDINAYYYKKEVDYVEKTRNLIQKEREFLKLGLGEAGYYVYDSQANYIFFQAETGLHRKLMEQNVMIRDCNNYPGLREGFYRIAVRTHEENEKLLDAIRKVGR